MTVSSPARSRPVARLYDADGHDRLVDVDPGMAAQVGPRQLLWIDLDARDTDHLEAVAEAVGLGRRLLARLDHAPERADLTQYPEHVHLVLLAMEPTASEAGDGEQPLVRRAIDVVAGHDWVVTVHDGPLQAFDRLDAATEGETRLGALDAAGFVAAIADEVLAGYLGLVEDTEREIDRLDERALRRPADDDVLTRVVDVRRRIGSIRRTLAPHRGAFAALARPDMALHEELGRPWPALTDRLERTLDAVENLRELLLGTFDIHMSRAAQEANDTMKILTVLSAVFLPAVVLAGVMGMNFQLAFFDVADNFWLVVAAMGGFAVTLLAVARWRGWF